jgi:hypothetical protein
MCYQGHEKDTTMTTTVEPEQAAEQAEDIYETFPTRVEGAKRAQELSREHLGWPFAFYAAFGRDKSSVRLYEKPSGLYVGQNVEQPYEVYLNGRKVVVKDGEFWGEDRGLLHDAYCEPRGITKFTS